MLFRTPMPSNQEMNSKLECPPPPTFVKPLITVNVSAVGPLVFPRKVPTTKPLTLTSFLSEPVQQSALDKDSGSTADLDDGPSLASPQLVKFQSISHAVQNVDVQASNIIKLKPRPSFGSSLSLSTRTRTRPPSLSSTQDSTRTYTYFFNSTTTTLSGNSCSNTHTPSNQEIEREALDLDKEVMVCK